MAIFQKILGTSTDKQISNQLAAEVAAEIRPELTVTRLQALSVNKTTRILERVLKKAQDYQQQEKMGFIRKARFANQFQWQLRDRGFSAEFASLACEGLVRAPAAKRRTKEG